MRPCGIAGRQLAMFMHGVRLLLVCSDQTHAVLLLGARYAHRYYCYSNCMHGTRPDANVTRSITWRSVQGSAVQADGTYCQSSGGDLI